MTKKINGKCAGCGQPAALICKCEVAQFRNSDENQGSEGMGMEDVFSANDFEAQNE